MTQFEDKPWDGSEGRWPDAASYCDSCLVDNNAAGAEKTKSQCHFPVKAPGSSVYNVSALHAVTGGRGSQAKFPGAAAAIAKAKGLLQEYNASQSSQKSAPPRENLFRALGEPPTLVRSDGQEMPTLTGHFAVFNQWTEINSAVEGHFLERVDAKAFEKTIRDGRGQMRVLFNHGKDPQIGDKVLGSIADVFTDSQGARYEVPLFDTSYNRDLIPGLEAGVYGSSFRFQVLREDFKRDVKRSDYNPAGLPERTILEARVREFGPVTFPAYAGATAGLRSITDDILSGDLSRELRRPSRRTIRMDTEDLSTLAQMMICGKQYIDEQDEPEDQANIPKMEAILADIAALVPYEVQEQGEDTEMEDEEDAETLDELDVRTEPEPEDATTDPAPEPVAATTRVAPEPAATTRPGTRKPAGLYPNRKETPSWHLSTS